MRGRPQIRLGVAALFGGVLLVGTVLAAMRFADQRSACPQIASYPTWSVARRWDEAMLDAIRRSLPNPPVHARNLFHVSVAMWDAWAAYDTTATGYVFTEKIHTSDAALARNEAVSYAAFRVLTARFIKSVGADASLSEFDDLMDSLCLPIGTTTTEGESAAAVGNRIAKAVLERARTDGANELDGYASPDYRPVNPPLVVNRPGITLVDPNRWQPLQIEHMLSQNGIPLTNGVQQAVGAHWGHVTPFAIPPGGASGAPVDPGPPPRFGDPTTDAAYRAQAIEVLRDSSLLDPSSVATVDISPGAIGANSVGTNDGHGRALNPATGRPYAADVVSQSDFYRALAEFWADGPSSETPPGHWNVLANSVSDQLSANLHLGGSGPLLDRLAGEVKHYFAVNGTAHDATIAAWGSKGPNDGPRR